MAIWRHELRLLLRSRMARIALVLLALPSTAAVAAGMAETARQRAAIDAIAHYADREKDAGSAAYGSFHPTWDVPAPLAFAVIGMRDVAPYILRVRALGREAQIYDGDTFNPELALPGRFDFAFMLVFFAPLFAIALFHDLKSGEREAVRARMLGALPGAARLWRGLLRFALLLAAVAVPFVIGAILSGVGIGPILLVVAVAVAVAGAYLLFWIGLAGLLTRLVHTDLSAQLAYQDRIRAFHQRLREFYYDYMFRDRPFGKADLARAPRYDHSRQPIEQH